MTIDAAVARLSALSHPTRLLVFKLLMGATPDGVRAGDIATTLDVAPSNLTAHLNILAQAGLIQSASSGRSRLYSVDPVAMSELLSYLIEDCCHGHPEICAPLAACAQPACA